MTMKQQEVTGEGAGSVSHVDGILPDGGRCRCGCVPDIMSMFEMAALRKKYREKLALEKAKEAERRGARLG